MQFVSASALSAATLHWSNDPNRMPRNLFTAIPRRTSSSISPIMAIRIVVSGTEINSRSKLSLYSVRTVPLFVRPIKRKPNITPDKHCASRHYIFPTASISPFISFSIPARTSATPPSPSHPNPQNYQQARGNQMRCRSCIPKVPYR